MFDFKTLTYYGVAGVLSLCLSILLATFSRFQPGTRSAQSSALAILVMACAYLLAAYGPTLPRWTLVLGTNMMLLGACAILHSGFLAFCEDREPRFDRTGWLIVAATAPPFWYWGLVEPDGNYRSAVFSFALAAIVVRTSYALLKHAWGRAGNAAVWIMGGLLGIAAAWMAVRGFVMVFTEAPPPSQRGSNPTTWVTVFAFIVLISLVTAATIWMEISRLRAGQDDLNVHEGSALGAIGDARNKLLLLWSIVMVLNIGIVSEVGVVYTVFYEAEKEQQTRTAELANDAFVEHTVQIVQRVDTVLHSVRSFHRNKRSLPETARFIASLKFDRALIDNVYFIDADGRIALSHDSTAIGRRVTDRAYYAFHRITPADDIFISAVESGRVTGKYHFRISRRISNPDGSFGGLFLATVDPEAFSRYYEKMLPGSGMLASLLGTVDHKLRARSPHPPRDRWAQVVESPLWKALEAAPSGIYENSSAIDGIRRVFTYRKVPDLPLVMVSAFSAGDLIDGLVDRIKWLAIGAAVVLAAILALAGLLTVEIRRRDEQDRFMSMLNHELKTPLSVIRMSLGDDSVPSAIRQRVTRAVFDMNAIVERSLQADRLHHGRIESSLKKCRISELLSSVVSNCIAPTRIDMVIDELPEAMTDAQLLIVILGNLIDNALKYSIPDGRVTVSAGEAVRRGRKGIVIAVANTPGGAGMPDVRMVFRKYYRSSGAHGKTGSGLGLHIAAGFADKIGGHLSYVPAPGEVKFELWIPL